MKFTYETQGANSFLVYAVNEKEEIDTLTLGMITNNKISGFLPAIFTQVDDIRYVKYNISSKISADQIFAGTVMKKQLLGIFLGISEAMLAAEDYMIPLNSLVLDLKYIYVDVSTYKAKLVCVPSVRMIEQDSLNVFLKKIMFNTRFDGSESTDYVARIISKLNASSSMSMNEFKEMIALLKNELSMDEQVGMFSQELGAWEYEKVFRDKIDSDNLKENQNEFMGQNQGPNNENQQGMQSVQNRQGIQGVQNGQGLQGIQNTQLQNIQGMQSVQNGQGMQGVQDNKKTEKEKQKKIRRKDETSGNQTQIPSQNNMMNIPGKNKNINNVNSNTNVTSEQKASGEKISLGHLLMHFSSENMAKYKAQKAENKNQKKMQMVNNIGNMNNAGNINNMGNANNAGNINNVGNVNNVGNINNMGNANNAGNANSVGNMNHIGNMQVQNIQGMEQQMNNGVQNISQMIEKTQNSNFGETIVLNAGTIGETVVLDSIIQNNSNMPYLVRKKTGERVNIVKPIFHIGKERSYADYFIADNSAISRSHANILLKNSRCFVMDTNSTNHTYIDGTMIPCNVEVELYSGNILKLADEEFEVHLI